MDELKLSGLAASQANGAHFVRCAVCLAPVISSEVKLARDFWRGNEGINDKRVVSYVPTESSRRALHDILACTSASTGKRVHLVTGSYGTGKSYLLLVLANLLGRKLGDGSLPTLLSRIRGREEQYRDRLTSEIDRAEELDGYRYLVVIPDYSDRDFQHAMLFALRQALREEGIDFRPRTEFVEALDLLDKWKRHKPDFEQALCEILQKHGSSLDRLEARLGEYESDALKQFQDYVEQITSVPFTPDRIKLEDTYREVAAHIKRNGLRGIAILFDEFGAFLQQFVNLPDGDAGIAIQDFIEFVKAEHQTQVLVVLAAHRALKDYVTGSSARDDIKKIEGRFNQEHRLRVSTKFHEAEEMVCNALVAPIEMPSEVRDSVLKTLLETAYEEDWLQYMARWYEGASDAWLESTIIRSAYPLHPATLLALPQLSEQIGQNTRTMFKFMDPNETGGLAAFIDEFPITGEDNRLYLYTIERLYDYFVKPLDIENPRHKEAQAAGLARQFRRALASLRSIDEELSARVLKTIAVLTLLADPRLQATREALAWSLNLSPRRSNQLKDLLDVLVDQGAIRQNRNTEIFGFRGSGETSIDSLMKRYRDQIVEQGGFDLVRSWREVHPIPKHDPYEYNDKFSTNRRVHFDYVTSDSLQVTAQQWQAYAQDLYEAGSGRHYKGNIIVLYGLIENEHDRNALLNARTAIPSTALSVSSTCRIHCTLRPETTCLES